MAKNKKLKKIIESALRDAAFMGYDDDDDFSVESFDELVEDTVKKIEGCVNKLVEDIVKKIEGCINKKEK